MVVSYLEISVLYYLEDACFEVLIFNGEKMFKGFDLLVFKPWQQEKMAVSKGHCETKY